MKTHYFQTNIKRLKAAINISNLLPHYIKGAKVQFDAIQDRFILQVRGPKLSPVKVISTMNDLGYKCTALPESV